MTEHPSFETYVYVDLAGGTSYTKIGQLKDISGPNISRNEIEVSHRDLPNNYLKFWGGYANAGEVSFEVVWDPKDALHIQGGTATGLLSDFERTDQSAQAAWKWESDIVGGTAALTFDGFLNSAELSSPEEGHHGMNFSVKINGKPTLAVT